MTTDLTGVQRRKRAAAVPPGVRRSSIIGAALPLLLQHGEKVKTQEIAVAAGIAEGTIFRVFSSKEELIDAVFEHALDPGPLEEAIAGLDLCADLEQTVTRVVALLERRGLETWQLITSVGPEFHRRYMAARRERGHRLGLDSPALTELFRHHEKELKVDPEEAARILLSIAVALTHPALIAEPMLPERIAGCFLHGVGAVGRGRC